MLNRQGVGPWTSDLNNKRSINRIQTRGKEEGWGDGENIKHLLWMSPISPLMRLMGRIRNDKV